MKKILFYVVLSIYSIGGTFAQTATDAGGDKIYRGNIALIVREDAYLNGIKQSTTIDLNSVTYVWLSQILSSEGFRIVNRDEQAMANIRKALTEYKMEDYLDGFSVQAKGQGADWLLLVDMSTSINENKQTISIDYSYRLVGVENNIGRHSKTHNEFLLSDEDKTRIEIQKTLTDNVLFFTDFLRQFFPVQFGIVSAKGRELKLTPYQPVGALTNEDRLYIYKYSNEISNYQGSEQEFNVLQLIAVADNFKVDGGGYLIAKTDKPISDINNTFACLTEKNTLALEQHYFVTVIGLPYDNDNEGHLKKMVNQSIYCALGNKSQFSIIESDLLPFLKEERELQKTEDFMDGHTVQQLKAAGAQYLIHISNFGSENDIISFTLSVLDIASNTIAKTFDCKCHVSNLDKAVEYYIQGVFTFPCAICKIDSKEVELYSPVPIHAGIGETFSLAFIKQMQAPTGGNPVYQRVELLALKYAEYQGMKHRLTVDKVLSKEDMKVVSDLIGTTNFFLLKDRVEPDMMKDNSIKAPAAPKKNFLNRLSESITIE